jgi:hypothetical protein
LPDFLPGGSRKSLNASVPNEQADVQHFMT